VSRTPVAVLGTLAEFHREPIPYDLGALLRLVIALRPDLLCLDLTPDEWQRRDFRALPPEYREALLPLAYQTDIVVAPIGGVASPEEPTASGWKGTIVAQFRRWLAYLQRTAPGPAAINQGLRHHLANLLYDAIALLVGRETYRQWKAHTDQLIRAVIEVVQRDPGRRVLVVVNVRHCHVIREALRKRPEVQVVEYRHL
jgi:hypothetical protein